MIFIARSAAMQSVDKTIDSLAYSDAIGFVVGESGTGKELAAESAHQHRKRCGNAFISISCSTIPCELITSELVGCIKVAFTGASSNREGVANVANGGTFFLCKICKICEICEICEMSLELQKMLLRFPAV
ncbi:MAG: sigma-54 factor interaction domain-containing protein [Polyangiaceae bacterium]|nr:sigma-54 factor interaction domain-containing protein [Polyangiaceae bacterium]